MSSRRRGMLHITAAIAILVPVTVWFAANSSTVQRSASSAVLGAAVTTHLSPAVSPAADLESLARRDPSAVVALAVERYQRDVRDYRATLEKQELLPDGMSPVQQLDMRYRRAPFAIYMIWKSNPSGARRALYRDAPEFVDRKGRKLARVEPHGTLVRLVTTDVFVQIHGPDARKNSRRTIDEAGFGGALELLQRFNAAAAARGVLDFRYDGRGSVDNRPTLRFIRRLPYEGPDGAYPDAKMILELDAEWLLPTSVQSFADEAQTQLLGRYVFTNVELNVGLGEDAFAF